MRSHDKSKLLAWLADCVRNNGVVTRPKSGGEVGDFGRALWTDPSARKILDPAADQAASEPSRSWLGHVGLREDKLHYEPRALAVSACGRSVAVGTKAGEVRVWSWQDERGWESDRVEQPRLRYRSLRKTRRMRPRLRVRAVRGLGFIDGDTLVVAGGNRRRSDDDERIAIYRRVHGTWRPARTVFTRDLAPPMKKLDEVRRRRLRHAELFERFPENWRERPWQWVPMWTPGLELPSPAALAADDPRSRILGLILTTSKLVYVVAAEWDPEDADPDVFRFRARLVSVDTLPPFEGLRPDSRLVGGTFWRSALWLIDSHGYLYHSVLPDAPASPRPADQPGPIDVWRWDPLATMERMDSPVPRPRDHALFVSLRACWDALALQAGGHFTLLPAKGDASQATRYLHRPETSTPHWEPIAGATSFDVFRAFADVSNGGAASDPIWLVVGSQEIGTEWIAWEASRRPDKRALAVKFRTSLKTWLPALCSESLQIAHGFHRGDGYDHPRGTSPCFLVIAARNHQVGIYSLINYTSARALLKALLPAAGPEGQGSPGLRLWYAQARMIADLHPRRPSPEPSEPAPAGEVMPLPRWFVELDASDVLFLGRQLRRCLRGLRVLDTPVDDPRMAATDYEGGARVVAAIQEWTLLLLQRAVELSPETRKELAATIMGAIEEYAWGPIDDLRLLSEQLRKWVVHGDTYKSKPEGIFDLVAWNANARRDLDSLTYALRLLEARVDQQWAISTSSDPEVPNHAVCSMVTDPESGFTLCSHYDGRLTAVDGDGEPIRFVRNRPTLYTVADDGLCLVPRDTAEYRQQHRHGRYASALALISLDRHFQRGRRPLYVLVLAMTGWQDDLLAEPEISTIPRQPLLVAMVVEFTPSRRSGPGGHLCLRGITYEQYADEIQTLDAQPLLIGPCGLPGVDVLVGFGTRDRREPGDESHSCGDALRRRHFAVIPRGARGIRIEPRQVPRRARRADPEIGAVTNLLRLGSWIFVADSDGQLVRVDLAGSRGFDATVDSVEIGSEITCITGCELADGGHLVAYGTSSGNVVALVWRPKGDGAEASPRSDDDRFEAARDGLPRVLLASAHADSTRSISITAVQLYDEPAPVHPRDPRRRLLAVDERGRVSVYDVAYCQDHRRVQRHALNDDWHPILAGTRLDFFSLPVDPRAVEALAPRSIPRYRAVLEDGGICLSEPHRIIVGDAKGQVRCYELGAMRKSGYRKALRAFSRELFGTLDLADPREQELDPLRRPVIDQCLSNRAGIAASVGTERVWRWLRMQDCGDLELLRFVLWEILHRAGERVLRASSEAVATEIKQYLKVLADLGDESYRRQPVTRGPVKILWSKASSLGNSLIHRALAGSASIDTIPPSLTREVLQSYLDLNRDLEVLTNRWAGYDSEFEVRTLIHAFQCIFDGSDVLLLMIRRRDDAHDGVASALRKVQEYLVRRLARARLLHTDSLVKLEALRTINLACLRALHWIRARGGASGPRVLPEAGFGELVEAVAKLAVSMRHRVLSTDPLAVELARFFALALLLFPDSSLRIARYISEARLISESDDRGLVSTIPRQARMLLRQLKKEQMHVGGGSIAAGIDHFREYLENKLNASALQAEIEARWGRECGSELLQEPSSNYRIAGELVEVQALRKGLSILEDERVDPSTLRSTIHFQETRRCFVGLADVRASVLSSLREGAAFDPLSTWENFERDALRVIDESGVVEPQRSDYRITIVRQWRRSFLRRTELSAQLLRTLAGRLVHGDVGRRIAMIADEAPWNPVTVLARGGAPSTFRGLLLSQSRPGRHRDALYQAFDELDNRILHLTFLDAARRALEDDRAIGHTWTTSTDVHERLSLMCEYFGLRTGHAPLSLAVPGPDYLWDVILVALSAFVAECSPCEVVPAPVVDLRQQVAEGEAPAYHLVFSLQSQELDLERYHQRATGLLRDIGRLCRVEYHDTQPPPRRGERSPRERPANPATPATIFLCRFSWREARRAAA